MAGRLISFQRNKATEAERELVGRRRETGWDINSIAEASRASKRACPVACIITPSLKRLYPSTSPQTPYPFPNVGKEETDFCARTQLHNRIEIAARNLEKRTITCLSSSLLSTLYTREM